MVLSLRGSMVKNNGNQSMESVDKQSVEPSEFLDELRSYELKNRRLLTATDIQNLELEYNEFVMNYFVYHQQFNTVAEYENSFLQLKRWAETWNEEKFDEQWVVDRFVAGLKEEIRNNVNLWRPEFLQRAIILAKWQELCLVDKVFDKIPEPTEAKTNYEIKKEFVYHEEIEREPSMKGNFMGLFTLVSSCHVSVFAPFICSSLITDCGCPTFKKIPGRVENSGISKLKENGLYWGERGKSENIKGTGSNYVLYPPILDVVQYNFDLFVIGAGSGDVVRASRFFAQYGAKVGICELPFHPISSKVIGGVGGTCVNRGCVPKMILVYGASFGPEIEDARNYGWEINEKNGFNWKKLWHKKTEGKVSGPNEVEITQLDDTKLSYTANHISVVTSNRAQHLAIPGQKLAITSDEVLSLEELPKSLVILGGGYIVVEFASIWRGMGANVNLCFIKELPLRGFDEMRAMVARNLKGRGINLHAQTTLTEPVKTDDGIKVRTDPGEELLADVVLFATGRSPNTKKLNMGVVGVELDETRDINVSEYFHTNIHSIWAAGDVTNQMNLTPMSLMEGTLFAKTIFGGEPSKPDYNNIPCVVFFIPPLSAVGLREEQAIEQEKGDILVFTSISNPMKNSISGRQEKAIMKLIVDGLTDKVLGVSMGGPDNSLHPTILDENINRPNEIFHLHIDGHLVVEGRYLLLGGADASVIVYDVHCAAEYVGGTIVKHKSILVVDKQHKHGHKYAVSLAIWYPVDTGLFIPGSYDHFISVWDTNTIQAVMHFKMHGKVYRTAMSTLATSHMLIAAEIEDVQVRLCVIASGAFSHILTSHLDGVMAVVTTSEWVLLTGECDGTIRFWDIRRVGCFLVLNQPHTQLGRCPPLLQRASIIKVSASKSFSTGQRLHPGFVPSQDRFTAHYGAIIGLKMIADGLYLLSAGYDSRLRLWDVESCCNTLANFDIVRFPTSKAMQLAITPDSGLLFVPCMTAAKAFSVWSGETMMTFRGHYENVNCCWYNVQDQELYTGGNDRQVLVWSPYKLSSEDENEQHDFVVRHPDHFRETPSPSSVVGSNMVGEIKSSGTGELKNLSCWDPVKVPMVELTVFIHDIKDLEHVHVLISPLVTDIPTVRRFIAINWVVLKWENSNPLCILVGTTNFLDPNILDAFTDWNKLARVNFEDKHEGRTSVCVIGKCGAVGDSKKDKLKRNAETWNPMNSSYVRKANGGDWESYNNTCILV